MKCYKSQFSGVRGLEVVNVVVEFSSLGCDNYVK